MHTLQKGNANPLAHPARKFSVCVCVRYTLVIIISPLKGARAQKIGLKSTYLKI